MAMYLTTTDNVLRTRGNIAIAFVGILNWSFFRCRSQGDLLICIFSRHSSYSGDSEMSCNEEIGPWDDT